MEADEWAEWRDLDNRFPRLNVHPTDRGRPSIPCSDCPADWGAQMLSENRCNGVPGEPND